MKSSLFYVEPLHVQLTSSTSKGFFDHYGFLAQIKKLIKNFPICLWHTEGQLYLQLSVFGTAPQCMVVGV